MAIVECGFPFGLTISGQPPLGAKAALSLRGPTVLVDIGFDPAFWMRQAEEIWLRALDLLDLV